MKHEHTNKTDAQKNDERKLLHKALAESFIDLIQQEPFDILLSALEKPVYEKDKKPLEYI